MDYGKFNDADNILNECLAVAENKAKVNQEVGLKLKAQTLQELGRNCMLKSEVDQSQRQHHIEEAEKYIADSIEVNEQFPDNHVALANNIEVFGEIELKKENFEGAKANFLKSS
jgi:glutamate mutase epsilon subunit